MKDKLKEIKTFMASIGQSFLIAFKTNHILTVLYIFLKVLMASFPILNLYVLNLILNEIVSGNADIQKLIYLIASLVAITVLSNILGSFLNLTNETMVRRIIKYNQMKYYERICAMPLSFLDSPEGRDIASSAANLLDNPAVVFQMCISIVSSLYAFFVAAAVLFRYNALYSVLLLILTLPVCITGYSQTALFNKFERKNMANNRYHSYYRWILTSRETAGDVRMYDLTDYMKEKYFAFLKKYLKERRQLQTSFLKLEFLFSLIKMLGILSFTGVLIFSAARNEITVGELTMYSGLAASLSGAFAGVVSTFDLLIGIAIWMGDGIKFYKVPCPDLNRNGKKLKDFESLEFRDVHFKYPQSDKYVLSGTSFVITKGQRISLVGINGAGKTTIVKLILGFYPATSGEILINGVPIEEYDIRSVRRHFSVLFQDFVKYPLTLRENVGLSDFERLGDDDGIMSAVARSGLSEDVEFESPDVYMSRQFDDNGIELSRGQWQKIALARAYFKDSDVLIFDEPSASLDPEAEDRIFRNFESISENRTGIMISHRISSAVNADKIIVLGNGVVEQSGTHSELMKQDGTYQKMYNLQKSKYFRSESDQ